MESVAPLRVAHPHPNPPPSRGRAGRGGAGPVSVRAATAKDLPQLLAIAAEFAAESDWGWTHDPRVSTATFGVYMAAPGHALLVADAGGALAGCIMAAAQRDFCTEAQGYIAKYYVRRAFRGGPAGRALIAAASAWFDANGVRCAFVAPLGRVGDRAQQMNVNLLAKHGFAPGGVLLVRDMDRCVQTPGLVSPPTLPSPARGEGTALHGRVGVAADVQGR